MARVINPLFGGKTGITFPKTRRRDLHAEHGIHKVHQRNGASVEGDALTLVYNQLAAVWRAL